MHKTNLRKVGGSVMLAVPPAILELMELRAGSPVNLAVEGSRLIVERQVAPHYGLDELLAQCDETAPMSEEDLAWVDAKPAGNELL
jgi:antitoxin ChpS